MAVESFPVESSHVKMFAYAIGDDNPVYSDPEVARQEGFENCLAPPTFVVSDVHFDPESGLRRRSRPTPQGEGGPSGGTGLHAEQSYEYHRPLMVGDVLTKSSRPGETWEKEGRRAGKLVFSEIISEYRDQKGELVITARMVGVRTERPVEESK